MKRSELKNIIKECVKEVIFEEGVLSGIISEVVRGTMNISPITETASQKNSVDNERMLENKRKVLSAIGGSGYENLKNSFGDPTLFEGTKPIPQDQGKGALSGVDPRDPGIDISSIPGAGNWANVVKKIN